MTTFFWPPSTKCAHNSEVCTHCGADPGKACNLMSSVTETGKKIAVSSNLVKILGIENPDDHGDNVSIDTDGL